MCRIAIMCYRKANINPVVFYLGQFFFFKYSVLPNVLPKSSSQSCVVFYLSHQFSVLQTPNHLSFHKFPKISMHKTTTEVLSNSSTIVQLVKCQELPIKPQTKPVTKDVCKVFFFLDINVIRHIIFMQVRPVHLTRSPRVPLIWVLSQTINSNQFTT